MCRVQGIRAAAVVYCKALITAVDTVRDILQPRKRLDSKYLFSLWFNRVCVALYTRSDK